MLLGSCFRMIKGVRENLHPARALRLCAGGQAGLWLAFYAIRMSFWLQEAMEPQSVGVEREHSGVPGLHGGQG